MDDWEELAEKENVVVPPPKVPNINKWDGEDEEEDVKESWEDEEEKKDEEKAEAKPVKTKPRKTVQEKISEKERERLANEQRIADQLRENMTPEEKLAEKLRLQKVQEEADLKAAMDTFGVTESSTSIDTMDPTNKEEFLELAQAISTKVGNFKSADDFATFVEELVRGVCAHLQSSDIRKIKTTVENLHLEKQKMEKEKNKKPSAKGKTKIKLRMDTDSVKSNNIGDYNYDYDYDDFM